MSTHSRADRNKSPSVLSLELGEAPPTTPDPPSAASRDAGIQDLSLDASPPVSPTQPRNDRTKSDGTLTIAIGEQPIVPGTSGDNQPPRSPSTPRNISTHGQEDAATNAISPDRPSVDVLKDPKLKIRESIGIYGGLVIFLGSLTVAASMAFLSYLWFATGSDAEAADAPRLWRRITLSGWFVQTTTLVALAIRTVVIAQGILCTSMIFALVLERKFIPKESAAHLSVLRGINNGPQALVQEIFRSRNTAVLLRPETLLVSIVLLVSVALQFTSTILLTDVSETVVTGDATDVELASAFADNMIGVTSHGGFYNFLPPQLAAFGELESDVSVLPDLSGFSDTGVQQRAWLPIADPQDRLAVRSYSGNTTTLSSRTSCMRPILDNVTYEAARFDGWPDHFYFGEMTGTLDYTSSIVAAGRNPACNSRECPSTAFSCGVPGSIDGWQADLCLVNVVGGQFWTINHGPRWGSIGDAWALNATIFLAISTNMRIEDWEAIGSSWVEEEHMTLRSTRFNHEWTSYELLPGRMINVSLCFNAFNIYYNHVSMSAVGDIQEPSLEYMEDTGEPNATQVLQYYGVQFPKPDHASRGIFKITAIEPPYEYRQLTGGEALTEGLMRSFAYDALNIAHGSNATISICDHCTSSAVSPHPDLASILGQIIKDRNRPALAIQTLYTSITYAIYNLYLSRFTRREIATVVSVGSQLAAHNCSKRNSCAGFVSVMVLLSIHMICVLAITVLYVSRVRYSRCSNIWHAVSQLVSEELRGIYGTRNNESDKVVMRHIREAEGNNHVRLGRSENSRIEIISA